MTTVRVELKERSYDIRVESGALRLVGEMAKRVCTSASAVVITNPRIGELYANPLLESLAVAGIRADLVYVPAGEKYKSIATIKKLYNEFISARLDRGSLVVALGGGVIGDLSGFAAATYLRGVAFLQVPTTLLAQVDSSVGGKTGINLPAGKNLVGAFHQPCGVLIDPDVLRTLPRREVRAGLAEVIKHGIISDQVFFEYLLANMTKILALDPKAITHAISRCCEIKAAVVGQDEKESGLREILNFGHTLGHGIENAAGYGRYRHGEALAIGMIGEAYIAERMGVAEAGTAATIRESLTSVGLPTVIAPGIVLNSILTAMALDKKARKGKLKFVLPTRIGAVVTRDDVPSELVTEALQALM
jgi:3-dehydroquinate synthase